MQCVHLVSGVGSVMYYVVQMYFIFSVSIISLSSQVDYRAKTWACNFCFQRNAVSNFFMNGRWVIH